MRDVGQDRMTCLIDSNNITIRLRNFGIMQQALAKELLEAKSLEMLETITSPKDPQGFKNLVSMLESGNVTMRIDIILTRNLSPREPI